MERNINKLKEDFHKLIDSIGDAELLAKFYDTLSYSATEPTGEYNITISEEERQQVFAAWEESENEEKLKPYEEVRKKLGRWLSK